MAILGVMKSANSAIYKRVSVSEVAPLPIIPQADDLISIFWLRTKTFLLAHEIIHTVAL